MNKPNTLFVGKVRLQFPVLASTNQYASEMLANTTVSEGTVISTPNQEAGRGQIGSTWESAPHQNVAMSIILHPTFLAPQQQFQLNIAISLAVQRLIQTLVPSKTVQVKWPNDILVDGRKVAGILIQNTISRQRIQSSIIGIGINVNQTQFSPTLPNATSVQLESQQQYAPDDVLEACCATVEQEYLRLRQHQTAQLQQTYYQHLYQYNEWACYARPQEPVFKGKIVGIDSIGKLLIEQDKAITAYGIKEIQFQ